MASHRSYSSAWSGLIMFAAAMLLIVGTFNIIEGILGLVDDKVIALVAGRLVAVDITGWAWTVLIFGAALVVAGLGLFTMRTWARITAIVVVALHFISQIGWFGAYPLWSLLMIGLDTVVLFALTARWSAATADPYGTVAGVGERTAVG
jgi:hypothetical protein